VYGLWLRGVKNVVEALHIPDLPIDSKDICRCDKCGSWKFEAVVCHTCQLMWSLGKLVNFNITIEDYSSDGIIKNGVTQSLEKKYGFNLTDFDLPDKRKALRNCVNPEMGLHILREAM
jgi:hypothetical protein